MECDDIQLIERAGFGALMLLNIQRGGRGC